MYVFNILNQGKKSKLQARMSYWPLGVWKKDHIPGIKKKKKTSLSKRTFFLIKREER